MTRTAPAADPAPITATIHDVLTRGDALLITLDVEPHGIWVDLVFGADMHDLVRARCVAIEQSPDAEATRARAGERYATRPAFRRWGVAGELAVAVWLGQFGPVRLSEPVFQFQERDVVLTRPDGAVVTCGVKTSGCLAPEVPRPESARAPAHLTAHRSVLVSWNRHADPPADCMLDDLLIGVGFYAEEDSQLPPVPPRARPWRLRIFGAYPGRAVRARFPFDPGRGDIMVPGGVRPVPPHERTLYRPAWKVPRSALVPPRALAALLAAPGDVVAAVERAVAAGVTVDAALEAASPGGHAPQSPPAPTIKRASFDLPAPLLAELRGLVQSVPLREIGGGLSGYALRALEAAIARDREQFNAGRPFDPVEAPRRRGPGRGRA